MRRAYQKENGTYMIPTDVKDLRKKSFEIGHYEVIVNPEERTVSVPIRNTEHGKEYLTFPISEDTKLDHLMSCIGIEFEFCKKQDIEEIAEEKLKEKHGIDINDLNQE